MSEELMRSYYAAYNSEDADQLAALVDDEVVLTSAAGEQRGKAAYIATYRHMIDQFIDKMEPLDIVASGGRATVQIIDRLTARKDISDFMGQRLTKGQTITLNIVANYRLRNGKIVAIDISPAG